MKWVLTMLIVLLICISAFAKQTLCYHSIAGKSRRIVDEITFAIGDVAGDEIHVQWQSLISGDRADYILDLDYATRSWHVVSPREGNDYHGKREGNQILLQGRYGGREINKVLKIDKKPFFYHPPMGLSQFVRSGQESLVFWVIRPDNLKVYKMRATRQKKETLHWNETELETVSVKWGLTGLLSKFVNQQSWYRVSDSTFVRSSVFKGKFMELIGE